ncbi:putative glucosylceramidase 3 [Zerene cesonia]|uniref:putative glucosylceramidase 3 n=1 Tax=Zerene cesonia TaxID=33412 RepID=UPI0018E5157F|nr:putative glucosylceramidase 3 [Zerene cesonia]
MDESFGKVIELQPDISYQTIIGFGGAVTDAVGINWKGLPDGARTNLINSYYSASGLEYSMIRTPIASSDYSTYVYYYNGFPQNDAALTNFTYTDEDIEYKIPFLTEAFNAASEELLILASVWSPPDWMKVENEMSKTSVLKEEYYQTYADYHCKFIQLYEDAGIPIWGVTTSNEPINGALGSLSNIQSLGWTLEGVSKWIKNNLGPTMQNCTSHPIKILAMDDQKLLLPLWSMAILSKPEVAKFVDGIAIHSYLDGLTPGSIVEACMQHHPSKFVLTTEYCQGSPADKNGPVDLGAWSRAEAYAVTILDDLTHNHAGFVDWNMALNSTGGPNWNQNDVDSTIIVNATSGEFYKQPMFYVMGHFSKFVPRGSKRINTVRRYALQRNDKVYDNNIYDTYPNDKEVYDHVAFITPKNTIVAIVANYDEALTTALRIGEQQIIVDMEAHSIVTVEFPYYG